MKSYHFPPKFRATAFTCPHCEVNSHQVWYKSYYGTHNQLPAENGALQISNCDHCNKFAYWIYEQMVFPKITNAPLPHIDMPSALNNDFNEARKIARLSPRGAAALLRLCLQKLMIELGESGKDINKDIGSLVRKGLPEEIQQALDVIRVVGNESVHPGELNIQDDHETVIQLFELINFIVEDRITKKKRIKELFEKLPEGKRKGILDRDKSYSTNT